MTTVTKLISIRELKEYVSFYNEGLVTWQDIANDIMRNHNKPVSARQVRALAGRQQLIHTKKQSGRIGYGNLCVASFIYNKESHLFIKVDDNNPLLQLGLTRRNRSWVFYHVYILWLHHPDKITAQHQSRVEKGQPISEESTNNIIVKVW